MAASNYAQHNTERRANRVTKDHKVDLFFYLIEAKYSQKSVKLEKLTFQ